MTTAIRPLRNAAALPGFDVDRPPFTSGFVLEMFWAHRRFSNAAENPKWNDNALSESRQDSDAYDTTAGRRDKRGSPVRPQAIDMAWVLACRSVGARAASCVFTNAINDVFGTVAAVERPEAWQ